MNDLTFIQMFSGIDGFRLGLERSRWECLWSNDNDKYACAISRKNYGDSELIEGDIKEIQADAIPEHTLLTAGFPCQSFSVAGKRKGFEDIRGTLFYDVARIVEAKKPKLLLLENVKGLLSAQEGYCFWRILKTLDELGYDVEWQVLNSKYFGVPQSRERVFIIGHLRESSSRQIFPIGEVSKNDFQRETKGQRWDVANAVTGGYSQQNARGTYLIAKACLTPDRLRKRQHGRRFKENGEPMFTLTGRDVHGVAIYDGHHKQFTREMGTFTGRENRKGSNWSILLKNLKIRRLTPTECERLQGFPDKWTEGVSDTQRYRLLGNAVTTNVVEYLGKRLKEVAELE